eukprot:3506383-Rhodomonas_salina.1
MHTVTVTVPAGGAPEVGIPTRVPGYPGRTARPCTTYCYEYPVTVEAGTEVVPVVGPGLTVTAQTPVPGYCSICQGYGCAAGVPSL